MATRRFTKGIDLVRFQEERFKARQMSQREAVQDLALQALADVRELTSGTLTPSQTRGAFARGDSPANSTPTGRRRDLTSRQRSRRGIVGGVPLLPINIQSARLTHSFRLVSGGTVTRRTINLIAHSPGGGVFTLLKGGTRKMVSRGFVAEMQRRRRARKQAFVQTYLRKRNP